MLVQITVRWGEREVKFEESLEGSPAEREEKGHALGKAVARTINEEALNEAAGKLRHPCCCGRNMENRGKRPVTVTGLDGKMTIRRTRYRCRHCGWEFTPADGQMQCGPHRVTQPLGKRICQLATVEHFTRLPQLVFDQHGLTLSHHEILDLAHDVGGAVDARRQAEVAAWSESADKHWPAAEVTPRRIYVSCDGILYCTNQREPHPEEPDRQRLKWQQMRVGCVYWQDEKETWHKQMLWGREEASAFGASLYRLACRCGYREADECIFAADGGEWCWNIHRDYFGGAHGILDWYHASEHVWETAQVLFPDDDSARAAWAAGALALLGERGGVGLSAWLEEELRPRRRKKRAAIDRLLNYIRSRAALTDYPAYRQAGWQIGTGMVESTARQLVGLRLKGPGMRWSEAGAVAVTALRAQDLNGHWHRMWRNLTMNA